MLCLSETTDFCGPVNLWEGAVNAVNWLGEPGESRAPGRCCAPGRCRAPGHCVLGSPFCLPLATHWGGELRPVPPSLPSPTPLLHCYLPMDVSRALSSMGGLLPARGCSFLNGARAPLVSPGTPVSPSPVPPSSTALEHSSRPSPRPAPQHSCAPQSLSRAEQGRVSRA